MVSPGPDRNGSPAPALGVVVPCFNEAACLKLFHPRLCAALDATGLGWAVTYVDDGSTDGTRAALLALAAADRRVGVLCLSRNFGKEAATTAGLDHSAGAAAVVIDADGQDPPELIPALVAAWQDGADVVFAQRRRRAGDSWLKRATAAGFYRLMRGVGDVALPPDAGDFRLLSRRALDAMAQLRERHRFMKGLFAWIGFPTRAVPYDRQPRLVGRSRWSYWRLWNLALEGITGFTVMPLKFATYVGLLIAALSGVYGLVIVFRTLLEGSDVPGYPSLLVVILFLGGAQLFTLGVIGEYLGRIFNETKHRPLYLVESYRPASDTGCPASRPISPS